MASENIGTYGAGRSNSMDLCNSEEEVACSTGDRPPQHTAPVPHGPEPTPHPDILNSRQATYRLNLETLQKHLDKSMREKLAASQALQQQRQAVPRSPSCTTDIRAPKPESPEPAQSVSWQPSSLGATTEAPEEEPHVRASLHGFAELKVEISTSPDTQTQKQTITSATNSPVQLPATEKSTAQSPAHQDSPEPQPTPERATRPENILIGGWSLNFLLNMDAQWKKPAPSLVAAEKGEAESEGDESGQESKQSPLPARGRRSNSALAATAPLQDPAAPTKKDPTGANASAAPPVAEKKKNNNAKRRRENEEDVNMSKSRKRKRKRGEEPPAMG